MEVLSRGKTDLTASGAEPINSSARGPFTGLNTDFIEETDAELTR